MFLFQVHAKKEETSSDKQKKQLDLNLIKRYMEYPDFTIRNEYIKLDESQKKILKSLLVGENKKYNVYFEQESKAPLLYVYILGKSEDKKLREEATRFYSESFLKSDIDAAEIKRKTNISRLYSATKDLLTPISQNLLNFNFSENKIPLIEKLNEEQIDFMQKTIAKFPPLKRKKYTKILDKNKDNLASIVLYINLSLEYGDDSRKDKALYFYKDKFNHFLRKKGLDVPLLYIKISPNLLIPTLKSPEEKKAEKKAAIDEAHISNYKKTGYFKFDNIESIRWDLIPDRFFKSNNVIIPVLLLSGESEEITYTFKGRNPVTKEPFFELEPIIFPGGDKGEFYVNGRAYSPNKIVLLSELFEMGVNSEQFKIKIKPSE